MWSRQVFFKIHYLLSDKMKLFNAAIFLFSSYAVCRFWLQICIYIETKHNCLNKRNLSTVFRNVLSLAYGVVVLTPLSTIFQLYNLYASLTFNVMLRFNVKCDLFKSHLYEKLIWILYDIYDDVCFLIINF